MFRTQLRNLLFFWESRIAPFIAIYLGWLYWPLYYVLKKKRICFVVNIAGGTGHILCELDLFFRKMKAGELDPQKRYVWIRKNDHFSAACVELYGSYFWYAKASYLLYELLLPLTIRCIPKVPQKSTFGLRESALKSTIANSPVLQNTGLFAKLRGRRFENALTQTKCRFLSYLRYKDITHDSGLSGLQWQLDAQGKYIRPISGQNYLNLLPLMELTELWNHYFKLKAATHDYFPLVTSKIAWKGLEPLIGPVPSKMALIHIKEKKANATAAATDPNSYVETLDYLRSSGYTLVFVGREKMPERFQDFSVINYSESPYASFKHDIALFQNCSLAIIGGSGIAYLADCFQKPYLYINSWHLATPIPSPLAIVVPTLLQTKEGRPLSFQEQIDVFLTMQADGTVLDLGSYTAKNASSDEILSAVQELEHLIEVSTPLTPLQQTMKYLRKGMPLEYSGSRYSEFFLQKHRALLL